MSAILHVSSSIYLLKQPSKIWTFTDCSLAVNFLSILSAVNSWSTVPSLTTTFCCPLLAGLPIRTSWSTSELAKKPSIWLPFLPSGKHVYFYQWITLGTIANQLSNKSLKYGQWKKRTNKIESSQFFWWFESNVLCERLWGSDPNSGSTSGQDYPSWPTVREPIDVFSWLTSHMHLRLNQTSK